MVNVLQRFNLFWVCTQYAEPKGSDPPWGPGFFSFSWVDSLGQTLLFLFFLGKLRPTLSELWV